MKIYDCFTFFNELDLLEIRLEELYKHVDYFVIVEATKTFTGEKKDLIFKKNKKRFSKWEDKIIYVSTDLPNLNFIDKLMIKLMDYKKLPKLGTHSLGLNFLAANLRIGRWKFVYFQRDKIYSSLKNLKNEDIIIFSDLDEIPSNKKFGEMIKSLDNYDYVYFKHNHYVYYLNGISSAGNWTGSICFKYKTLRQKLSKKLSYIRNPSLLELISGLFGRKRKIKLIKTGGWHFSYLGGAKKVLLKSNSVAEAKNMDHSEDLIEKNIRDGTFQLNKNSITRIDYIPLDDSFPQTILKNRKKYHHLIKKI